MPVSEEMEKESEPGVLEPSSERTRCACACSSANWSVMKSIRASLASATRRATVSSMPASMASSLRSVEACQALHRRQHWGVAQHPTPSSASDTTGLLR